jgi:hypothetical protein
MYNRTSTPSSSNVNTHQSTLPTSLILQQPTSPPLQVNDQTTKYETFMHREFIDQLQNQSHSTNQPSFSRTHVSETLFSYNDQHNQSVNSQSSHNQSTHVVVTHKSQHSQPLYATSSPTGRQPSSHTNITGISPKRATSNDSAGRSSVILNRTSIKDHPKTQLNLLKLPDLKHFTFDHLLIILTRQLNLHLNEQSFTTKLLHLLLTYH